MKGRIFYPDEMRALTGCSREEYMLLKYLCSSIAEAAVVFYSPCCFWCSHASVGIDSSGSWRAFNRVVPAPSPGSAIAPSPAAPLPLLVMLDNGMKTLAPKKKLIVQMDELCKPMGMSIIAFVVGMAVLSVMALLLILLMIRMWPRCSGRLIAARKALKVTDVAAPIAIVAEEPGATTTKY
ncbi:unnamed protein product [Strongylus vulgaris]|uniref:Uncharacterized protein n=1 Tax=Strongylus vulgaris TaxID=40348 RepID=A0A3P7KTX9_STRVU|nr:unnamed protein product [Strongylus vulgaris]